MADVLRGISPARIFARPTADAAWLGPAQQSALSHLTHIAPIKVLVGPSSCGLTTLLRCVAAELEPRATTLRLAGPKQDSLEVLTALVTQAGLGTWQLDDNELRNLLTTFVERRRAEGFRVPLTIDDAHCFTRRAWQEIERLALLRYGQQSALELVIGTHGDLPGTTNSSSLILLNAGKHIHKLAWLDSEDVDAYINWRLERFGLGQLFTATAKHLIHRYTEGRFRGIDLLCQMALLLLKRHGLSRVDVITINAAVRELKHNHVKTEQVHRELATAELDHGPIQGRLIITRAKEVVARIALSERTLIGRSEYNDICLESPHVSRHHTAIVRTPTGYHIADLNSSNGTILNGRNVTGAELCDQDIVQVGDFRLKFEHPELISDHAAPGDREGTLETTAIMQDRAINEAPPLRIVR